LGERITITQDESTVTITDDNAQGRVIYTDGRQASASGQSLGQWKKGKLIVRTEGPRGELKETMELAEEGTTLFVTVSMQSSGGRGMKFKRVYTRDAGAAE